MCLKLTTWGPGGGQVVSVLALNSYDPSSHPADADSFFVKLVFEMNEKTHYLSRKCKFHIKILLYLYLNCVPKDYRTKLLYSFVPCLIGS